MLDIGKQYQFAIKPKIHFIIKTNKAGRLLTKQIETYKIFSTQTLKLKVEVK